MTIVIHIHMYATMKAFYSLYSQIRAFRELSGIHYLKRMLKLKELDMAMCLKCTMITRLMLLKRYGLDGLTILLYLYSF